MGRGAARCAALTLSLAEGSAGALRAGARSPACEDDVVRTRRTRAEDFLELVERGRRGRLKLYIGFAAGVGKTYRMLEEAHALKKRGVDVVLGFVETHGRAETAGAGGGPRGGAAQGVHLPRRHRGGDGPGRGARAQAPGGHRGRAGPHQRPPVPQRASATRTCRSCSTPASTSSAPSTCSTWRASTIWWSAPPASPCARRCPTASSRAPIRW